MRQCTASEKERSRADAPDAADPRRTHSTDGFHNRQPGRAANPDSNVTRLQPRHPAPGKGIKTALGAVPSRLKATDRRKRSRMTHRPTLLRLPTF